MDAIVTLFLLFFSGSAGVCCTLAGVFVAASFLAVCQWSYRIHFIARDMQRRRW